MFRAILRNRNVLNDINRRALRDFPEITCFQPMNNDASATFDSLTNRTKKKNGHK